MLGPADLKGLYIGWGQHLVREQFDWLFEGPDRVLLIDEFDAISRSRTEAQMHSDEKADVNELLVQLDRAGRLGRMVLATTNYVTSVDEAVLRNGRFGHFVPVPPPCIEEAIAIVDYYLARLGKDMDGQQVEGVLVTVPGTQAVRAVVAECFAAKGPTGRFCGADLEAAVGIAFRRRAREATAHGPTPSEVVHVNLTENDVREALRLTRRSVSEESINRFLDEVRACSPEVQEDLEREFSPGRGDHSDAYGLNLTSLTGAASGVASSPTPV